MQHPSVNVGGILTQQANPFFFETFETETEKKESISLWVSEN